MTKPIKWNYLSSEDQHKFSMDNTIKIYDWYIDDSQQTDSIIWNDELVNDHIARFTPTRINKNKHGKEPYGYASLWHVFAFEKYHINNKKIAVIGSLTPWIEAIAVNYNNTDITTVEYNVPVCNHKCIKTISYTDFINSDEKYDIIISYSSIEHSGLGRYGDPINPDGDIETVDFIHKNLNDDGLLLLGIPVGKDCVTWNAHRVYGHIRLQKLLKNFTELEWIGVNKTFLDECDEANNGPQPIIVLKKNIP